MKKHSIDMTEGPLFTGIVRYTIPIMLSGLLQLLFHAADLVVVGQFCGSISVGAVSATGAITNLIVNLFAGLSIGAGVSVAHALGGKENETVYRTVHTTVPMALVSGGILTIAGILLTRPLLQLMRTPDNVLPLSAQYMTIYFAGITFTIMYNYCAAILRAAGDTRSPLLYLVIAGVVNVILNVVFVTLFHMNVAGVALATIISQGISAVLVVRALMRRTDACRLHLKQMHIYQEPLLKMIKIGLPAGVQGSLFSISNVIIQSAVNSFSSDAIIAGNGAAASLEGFVYVSINAFSQTAVNYIGQNTGARQYHRIKKIFWTCLGCVTVVGIVLGQIFYAAGPFLLKFYITDSREALEVGLVRLVFICVPYFLCGLMDVATGALRGLGSSFVPMVVTVLGVCGMRIFWVYTIFQVPRFHTMQYLYLSYPISWTVTFLIQFTMFYVLFRKKQRQEALRKH